MEQHQPQRLQPGDVDVIQNPRVPAWQEPQILAQPELHRIFKRSCRVEGALPRTVYSPPPITYDLDGIREHQLVDCEVSSEGLDYRVRFSVDPLLRFTPPLRAAPYDEVLDDMGIEKIPHELVCWAAGECFVNTPTDAALGTIAYVDRATDRMSPDFIIKNLGDKTVIVEIKTNRGRRLESVFEDATLKYLSEIQRRVQVSKSALPVYFFVVVVGNHKVVTNLRADDEWLANVKTAFSVGQTIQLKAKALLWQSQRDVTLSDRNKALDYMIIRASMDKYFAEDAPAPVIAHKMIGKILSPIDLEAVDAHKKKLFEKAQEDLVNMRKPINYEKLISDFYARCKAPSGVPIETRLDHKTPFQLCSLKELKSAPTDFRWQEINQFLGPLSRLWYRLFQRSEGADRENFVEMDPLEALSLAIYPEERAPELRKNWHRVWAKLTEDEKVHFAMQGIEAKKFRNLESIQQKKARSKLPFDMDCFTDDFDEILTRTDLLKKVRGAPMFDELIQDLRDREHSILSDYENKENLATMFWSEFGKTQIGETLSILENILQEVNASMNQFCRKGEFVLKKCLYTDIWLLLKPTTAASIIFFSILVPKDKYANLGVIGKAPSEQNDRYMIYDFVSLNRHRLSHLMSAREKSCMMFSMWAELFGANPIEALKEKDNRVFTHWVTSQMVLMEGKRQTSTNLQLARYAYMECVRNSVLSINPLKILTKMDEIPRSRLLVWFYKRMIRTFKAMTIQRPRFEVAETDDHLRISDDRFRGLFSFVDYMELPTFECALNLSYLGSIHNRDEMDYTHGSYAIFEKVVKEEKEMRRARAQYMGFDNEPNCDYRDHEFSIDMVKEFGDRARERLEQKHSGEFQRFLMDRLYEENYKKTWEQFATLKSSANPPKEETFDVSDDKVNKMRRRRALEAMIELLDSKDDLSQHPFENLDFFLEELEDEKLRVELFMKPQIGGVREIFILTGLGRVVINFLETISRIICDELDMEMLTKGDSKLLKSDKHFTSVFLKMKEQKLGFKLSCVDSDDATTWCQRFVMPVFATVLSRLLPVSLWKICCRILNCVTLKELVVPPKLLEDFTLDPETTSFSKQINTIKKQFLTQEGRHDIINFQGRYIHNRSNMMQGILHFTSSVLHGAYMCFYEQYCQSLFKAYQLSGVFEPLDQLEVSTKESSDDSSAIKTLMTVAPPKSEHYIFLTLLSLIKRAGYPMWTAKQSDEKSTIGCFSGIEEFNSFWTINNTLLTPIIKIIYSGQNVKVITRMETRQTVMADLRKQILEYGGSVLMAAIAQECHFRTHYYTLGSLTSGLFKYLSAGLIKSPHPAYGYFITEPHHGVGILGYDFAAYMHVRLDVKYNRTEWSLYRRAGFEITDTGKPTLSTLFHTGKSTKYKEFLQRLNVKIDWREIFEYLPEKLYNKPQNLEDAYLKILKKAHNPSASEAFSFQSGAKVYSASVYILNTQCITVVDKNEPEDSRRRMTSLLRCLEDQIVNREKLQMDQNIILTLYSSYALYDEMMEMMAGTKKAIVFRKTERKPKRMAVLQSPKIFKVASVSLYDMVRNKWWQQKVRASNTELTFAWNNYTRVFPWLKEKADDTLEASPFESHIALSDFIIGQSGGQRHFKILGPVRKNLPMTMQLHQIIKKCYLAGHVVMRTSVKESEARTIGPRIVSELILASKLPRFGNSSDFVVESLRNWKDMMDFDNMSQEFLTMSRPETTLAIMQGVAKGKLNVLESIPLVKNGTIGMFAKPQLWSQQRNMYLGEGLYIGVMEGITFRLHVKDEFAELLEVQSDFNLRKIAPSLRHLLEEMRWRPRVREEKMRVRFFDIRTGQIRPIPTTESVSLYLNTRIATFETAEINPVIELASDGNLRLLDRQSRDRTILRLKLSEWKWKSQYVSREPVRETISDVWNSFSPIEFEHLKEEVIVLKKDMDMVKNKYDEESVQTKDLCDTLKEWLKNTLLARCSFKMDKLTEEQEEQVPVTREVVEADEGEVDLFLDMLAAPLKKIEVEEVEPDDQTEVLLDFSMSSRFDDQMLHDMLESTGFVERGSQQSSTNLISVEGIHPFWDKVINHVTSELKINMVALCLDQYRFDVGEHDSVLGYLAWLLDNHTRPSRVSAKSAVIEKSASSRVTWREVLRRQTQVKQIRQILEEEDKGKELESNSEDESYDDRVFSNSIDNDDTLD